MPKLEKTKVQEAMLLISGQDYKSAVVPDKRLHHGRHRGRAYAAQEDEVLEDIEEFSEVGSADPYSGFYECDWDGDDVEDWDDPAFDGNAAGYFQEDHYPAVDDEQAHVAEFDVDVYDEAYGTYLDARRRFQGLKLRRGFFPVVALQDGSAAAGPSSPSSSVSPPRKGKGPRKGARKGKGRFFQVHRPCQTKSSWPNSFARPTMCAMRRHWTPGCSMFQAFEGRQRFYTGVTRALESMAATTLSGKGGMVIFEDSRGRKRVECSLLDPGVSAPFIISGPFHRYVQRLVELGYPVESIAMRRAQRTFHFGGDHSALCEWWVAKIPIPKDTSRW